MVSQPRINYIHTVFDRTYALFLLSLIERGLALFFSFINNSAFKLSDLVWLFSVLCSVPNFRGCPLSRFPQIDPNCCSTFLNFSYHAKTVLGEGNKKKEYKRQIFGGVGNHIPQRSKTRTRTHGRQDLVISGRLVVERRKWGTITLVRSLFKFSS